MGQDGNAYLFSVVMAVYNSAPYLAEAVESLVQQDIGFKNIQVILVDDGSTDESPEICDRFAEKYKNIIAIHQKNGGPSAARNAGLEIAKGKYLNFMDSDDKMSPDAFRLVYRFMESHLDEVDMASIPVFFFDAKSGDHWQNTKFSNGDRVIDLTSEWNVQETFVNSSFYHREVLQDIRFDIQLPNSEDFKVNLQVLAKKQKLGVVTGCMYHYRTRAEATSIMQGITRKAGWYTAWFTYFVDDVISFYKQKFGTVPGFVQYAVLCDLIWRFKNDYESNAYQILDSNQLEKYFLDLRRALQYFDDMYFLNLPGVTIPYQTLMLSYKHDSAPEVKLQNSKDVVLSFGETNVSLKDVPIVIELVSLDHGTAVINGHVDLCGFERNCWDGLKIMADHHWIAVKELWSAREAGSWFGHPVYSRLRFEATIPLNEQTDIEFYGSVSGKQFRFESMWTGRFVPVNREIISGCAYVGPWKYFIAADRIRFLYRPKFIHRAETELRMWVDLWRVNQEGMRKAIPVRALYYLMKLFHRKPILLISDRVDRAGDNGEALFRYIRENHATDVDAYFILDPSSVDFKRMKQVGPVIPYLSRKHKYMQMLAACSISSSGYCMLQAPFPMEVADWYKDLYIKPLVFLQHGITKDDQSAWLNRFGHNIHGFVTSAWPEYREISDVNRYFYPQDDVWLTGMPRFDRLHNHSKKKITVMPTWRKYLMGQQNKKTGVWEAGSGYANSEYVRFYSMLLSDQRLIKAAREYGYTLQFYPHPVVLKHIDVFNVDPSVKVLHEDTAYSDVYAESDLVISDYSSAVFDFAYLKKPIIYAHFDAGDFFAGNHVYKKGYFDYERDGFGEVTHTLDETVEKIITYISSGCTMPEKYKQRVDQFFAFTDQDNCKRVYEHVMDMLAKDQEKKSRT